MIFLHLYMGKFSKGSLDTNKYEFTAWLVAVAI